MRSPGLLLVLLGAAVLTACGAEPVGEASIPPHQPSVVTGPSGTVDVVVKEPVGRAEAAIRYLRVEDDNGRAVLEREFRTAPAELSAPLAAARYRVITWTRGCTGSCQGASDATLGKAERICGTRVTIAEGAVARVSVDAPSDADCSMSLAKG